jgi:predicted nucleic acid-binding protein
LIALDASALIAYLEQGNALHERARAALLKYAGRRLYASVMTLAEVLAGAVRQHATAPVAEALTELDVRPVELRAYDHLELAELRARTGLKMPDCIVLLAARETNAAVLSFDERLLRAARDEGIAVAA